MSVARRFLVAPSLVRLIRKERGGARVTEGFFPPQSGRSSYVRVEGNQCQLILATGASGQPATEERTEVPRAHGDALLDVCAGKVAFDRTPVALGQGIEASVDRYVAPGGLDVVSVVFETAEAAQAFVVPAWFGAEVSNDAAYESRAVALSGAPSVGDIPVTNAALDAALDLFEHRFGLNNRFGGGRSAPEAGASLRRPEAPTPAPKPAEAPPTALPAASELRLPATEPAPAEDERGDARIDDVIESLSQALGATVAQGKEAAPENDPVAPFERWTVRNRRSQS